MTTDPNVDKDVQVKATIPQTAENGVIMFSGPMMSAKKLGKTRPNIEDAFKMERR